MRAVVQRVLSASVTVASDKAGEIGPGLLVFLGVGRGDEETHVRWMAEKIAHLRIFEDDAGKMNRSLLDTSKALLVVSQFTLYGDAHKGRRPSFVEACEPKEAERLYEKFCDACRALGLEVKQGVFRADMKVALLNDGPVTLWLDTAFSKTC
jgi:D-tyrosyl-tRNA(Tyr) deacylase